MSRESPRSSCSVPGTIGGLSATAAATPSVYSPGTGTGTCRTFSHRSDLQSLRQPDQGGRQVLQQMSRESPRSFCSVPGTIGGLSATAAATPSVYSPGTGTGTCRTFSHRSDLQSLRQPDQAWRQVLQQVSRKGSGPSGSVSSRIL